MKIYKEVTKDRGYIKECYARDNQAEYWLTSARAHDMVNDYMERYEDYPSSRWFNRHFRFKRVK